MKMKKEGASVTYSYRGLIKEGKRYNIDLDFTASLVGEEARFEVKIKNGHDKRIREVRCGAHQHLRDQHRRGLEENVAFTREGCRLLDGRQTRFYLL